MALITREDLERPFRTQSIEVDPYTYNLVSSFGGDWSIYMGGAPPIKMRSDFTDIFLCAREYQPDSHLFGEARVHQYPFFDDYQKVTPDEFKQIALAVAAACHAVENGGKILITCMAGLNRSGLVTALTLMKVKHMRAMEAIFTVRMARGPRALSNPIFESIIKKVGETSDERF